MMKGNWKKKVHSYLGIFIATLMILFSISGIILNHKSLVSSYGISRKYLPSKFEYKQWNNSLIRADIKIAEDSILLYGNTGVFLYNNGHYTEFNKGFPKGVANRQIRSIVKNKDNQVYALNSKKLYKLNKDIWEECSPKFRGKFSDMLIKGDSLVILGRSNIYVNHHNTWEKIELRAADNYDNKVSLFRTIWFLHSGELFGKTGKYIVDFIAIILIIVSLSGIIYFISKKSIKKINNKRLLSGVMIKSVKLHNKLSKTFFILMLIVCVSGCFLRPPLLLSIIWGRVPAIPLSKMDNTNPWNGLLRNFKYDNQLKDWLLYTENGYYSFKDLHSIPKQLNKYPPTSIMGINAWQRDKEGRWLIGSFSGLYTWDRTKNECKDFFTDKLVISNTASPFGKKAITGIINNIGNKIEVVEYENGSNFDHMPEEFKYLDMSLWEFFLDCHTGRIFSFLGTIQIFYIFISGLIIVIVLLTGFKIRLNARKKKRHNN